MMTKPTSLSLVAALAACGDMTSDPAPGPGSGRTITGTATFVTTDEAGAATTFPIGLHDTLVIAQFPLDDGFDVHEGRSNGDGTFAIDDAPDGDYWLDVDDVPSGQRQFLWTNASALGFEERGAGRGDAVAATPGTTLTFQGDGLDPVHPDDSLEIASGNLGFNANLFGALQAGSRTFQITRGWEGLPVVSAAKHDHLIVTQLRAAQDPTTGVAYVSPIASANLDAIEQQDGRDTKVTATFTPPPALDYDLRWNRSAFAAAATDIHPTRVGPVSGENFTLRAQPGGSAYGTSPVAALVLAVDSNVFTGATDLDLPFAIANPYPASWLFDDFVMVFPVTIPVPDVKGATFQLLTTMEVKSSDLPGADHPVVPLVTPPRTPTIEGLDLFADHDGVGLTPSIAWSAPAQGTPAAYVIIVENWDIQFDFSDLTDQATLIVPGDVTSVRLPARLLEPGEHYLLRIAAVTEPELDVRAHSLYALGLPFGFAELVSNTFSP